MWDFTKGLKHGKAVEQILFELKLHEVEETFPQI